MKQVQMYFIFILFLLTSPMAFAGFEKLPADALAWISLFLTPAERCRLTAVDIRTRNTLNEPSRLALYLKHLPAPQRQKLLETAIQEDNLKLIIDLLKGGISPDTEIDKNVSRLYQTEPTLIHWAVLNKKTEVLEYIAQNTLYPPEDKKRWLIQTIEERDPEGFWTYKMGRRHRLVSGLYVLAEAGRREAVFQLLDLDPKALDNPVHYDGKVLGGEGTVLFAAARSGDFQLFEKLVKLNPSLLEKFAYFITPFKDESVLSKAVRGGNVQIVDAILNQLPALLHPVNSEMFGSFSILEQMKQELVRNAVQSGSMAMVTKMDEIFPGWIQEAWVSDLQHHVGAGGNVDILNKIIQHHPRFLSRDFSRTKALEGAISAGQGAMVLHLIRQFPTAQIERNTLEKLLGRSYPPEVGRAIVQALLEKFPQILQTEAFEKIVIDSFYDVNLEALKALLACPKAKETILSVLKKHNRSYLNFFLTKIVLEPKPERLQALQILLDDPGVKQILFEKEFSALKRTVNTSIFFVLGLDCNPNGLAALSLVAKHMSQAEMITERKGLTDKIGTYSQQSQETIACGDEMVARLNDVLATKYNDKEAQLALARYLSRQGRHSEAEAKLQMIAQEQTAPDESNSGSKLKGQIGLALSLMNQNKLEDAKLYLKQALENTKGYTQLDTVSVTGLVPQLEKTVSHLKDILAKPKEDQKILDQARQDLTDLEQVLRRVQSKLQV